MFLSSLIYRKSIIYNRDIKFFFPKYTAPNFRFL